MPDFLSMLAVETRKAIRSRMPLWTALGALFMPLGMGFLIFLARNPELSSKLGLAGAKANLVAYSSTDWSAYLALFNQVLSAGGFFFFVMAIGWVFGREFADGTLKDLLAVPIPRGSILLAKFVVSAVWCLCMAALILIFGVVMGVALRLPGGALEVAAHELRVAAVTAGLVILTILPFGFFASAGRGYLLPLGAAVLLLITANLMMVAGVAEYFPWAVPLLYTQGESPLRPVSYWLVVFTGLAGVAATYYWWKYADQNR